MGPPMPHTDTDLGFQRGADAETHGAANSCADAAAGVRDAGTPHLRRSRDWPP